MIENQKKYEDSKNILEVKNETKENLSSEIENIKNIENILNPENLDKQKNLEIQTEVLVKKVEKILKESFLKWKTKTWFSYDFDAIKNFILK